jgi:hypothetical protein
MVLTNGKTDVEKLLGGDVAGLKVEKIGVGTSDTAVTAGDTALAGAVIKDVEDVNYLGGNVVEFRTTLDAGDPAMTIQEVGLLDVNNVLLFRKLVSPRIKSAGVSASVYYRVKVQ